MGREGKREDGLEARRKESAISFPHIQASLSDEFSLILARVPRGFDKKAIYLSINIRLYIYV